MQKKVKNGILSVSFVEIYLYLKMKECHNYSIMQRKGEVSPAYAMKA